MKVNKKQIGLVIGLVCVVICVVLLLTMCGNDNEVIDETTQTGESTVDTEATQQTEPVTEESTEATEESTEESTEETTEETTEPTTETTIPVAPPSTNNAIGSPGSVGSANTEPTEESTEPTEPEKVEIIPAGSKTNPYVEVIREYPASFESVAVPGQSGVYYALYQASGAILTIEDENAYVIHDGVKHESTDGVVSLTLKELDVGPIVIQLGSNAPGDKAFILNFKEPLGEPSNPEIVESIEELKVDLKEDDKTGYTFQWTAAEDGEVTFTVDSITENVKCNVILTVGDVTVMLHEESEEETEEVTDSTETTETPESTEETQTPEEKHAISVAVRKDDVLTIQIIALPPEKEEETTETPEGTQTEQPEGETGGETADKETEDKTEEKLPAAQIILKGHLENLTLPSETVDPSDATETTDPVDSSDPTQSPESSEPTTPSETPYIVKVTDYNGNPKTGVAVKIMKDGAMVEMLAVNSEGVAQSAITEGEYTVELLFSGEKLHYEEKTAVLSPSAPSLTIRVAPEVKGTSETLTEGTAYYVGVGGTYVDTQANVMNYFLFEPTVAGNYRFTTSDPEAEISFWGGSIYYVYNATESTDFANNAFTRNVKEGNIGATYVIGVTGAEDCILEITRLGDPILDESDFPRTEYTGTKSVQWIPNLPSGKTLSYVDLTAATDSIKMVLSEVDGYYHMESATGPVVYVNLGEDAPYISMYNMLGLSGVGGTSFTQVFYENGVLVKHEDYTNLMIEYARSAEKTYGLYPLTEDLKYMLQQGGDYKGWWNSQNPNYMFQDVTNLNTEIAWMFACCTVN